MSLVCTFTNYTTAGQLISTQPLTSACQKHTDVNHVMWAREWRDVWFTNRLEYAESLLSVHSHIHSLPPVALKPNTVFRIGRYIFEISTDWMDIELPNLRFINCNYAILCCYGELYCNSLNNLSLNPWKCNWHTECNVLQLVYNMNKHSRVWKKTFLPLNCK